MKYIIKGEDGKEYGPVDEETLRKWTESGRVLPETPVRNALIKKWNKASDLDFLVSAFSIQSIREEDEKSGFGKFSEHFENVFGGKGKKKELTPWETSFKNKYIHDPASVSLRISAFVFDLFVIGGISIFLMMHFHASFTHPKPLRAESAAPGIASTPNAQTADTASAQPADATVPPKASSGADADVKAQTPPQVTESPSSESSAEVNSAFDRSFYILLVCVLLYYGLSLGIFAQTFGMWFWGIMLSKPDLGEVFFGRAYFYTILMLLLGVLSPLFVILNPYKRSLHEILSGTMVIRTSARPK